MVFTEANMATATSNVGLYVLTLKTVCGGICVHLWAGDITKGEEEKENSYFNDGSMRSNSGNIRTEEYSDVVSEPGVVGSGCGWLHRAGFLPEL